MATIATTTQANPFQYPGQTLLAKNPAVGTYICLVKASTADNYVLYRSTDKGATWGVMTTVVRTNVADIGQIFMDKYGWIFWAFRTNESSQDRIYLRVYNSQDGTLSGGETLLANPGNGGTPGTTYQGVDLRTFYNVSEAAHYVAVAVGTNSGTNEGVTLLGAKCGPAVNASANFIISGTRQWMHPGTGGRVGPSMDTEHDGSGYDGYKNLWVMFGRTDAKLIKVSWSGAGWTGPASDVNLYTTVGTPNQMCLRWANTQAAMVLPDPINTSQVMLLLRNRANSATTITRTTNHPTGVVRNCVCSYNDAGDIRVWAVGTSTAVLYQNDYTMATGLWSGWGSTGLPAILGAGADNYGAKRSTYSDARWGLYTAASGAPNTLTYTALQQSYSPNTPTWLTPANGQAADVALTLPLTWQFTDNDPGDTQSAYAISRQVGSGALTYWRATDNTWQTTEIKNTASTSSITVLAAWALATDANYTFKAKVWDSDNNASGYSAGLVVVPSTPVNPAVATPTPSQVLSTSTVTVTWSASEQKQYRIRLKIQGGAQVYDSGWIGNVSARSFNVPYTLATLTSWTVTLNTTNVEGLASADQTRDFSINFTPPATPTLVVTPIPASGIMRVAVTNPVPGGAQPAVANQDLARREVGGTATVRVATLLSNNATYDDWKAVGGKAYEYQVTVFGINGAAATSAWTA